MADTIDHAEFGDLARTLAEQTGIFNRNRGLIGKNLQRFHHPPRWALVGERVINRHYANQFAFGAIQRHHQLIAFTPRTVLGCWRIHRHEIGPPQTILRVEQWMHGADRQWVAATDFQIGQGQTRAGNGSQHIGLIRVNQAEHNQPKARCFGNTEGDLLQQRVQIHISPQRIADFQHLVEQAGSLLQQFTLAHLFGIMLRVADGQSRLIGHSPHKIQRRMIKRERFFIAGDNRPSNAIFIQHRRKQQRTHPRKGISQIQGGEIVQHQCFGAFQTFGQWASQQQRLNQGGNIQMLGVTHLRHNAHRLGSIIVQHDHALGATGCLDNFRQHCGQQLFQLER